MVLDLFIQFVVRKMFSGIQPGNNQTEQQRGYTVYHFKARIPGMQRRMISVDTFFVFLRLLVFAVLLLYVT